MAVICARYIPTHVGKSSALLALVLAATVHPHARGEIDALGRSCYSASGTSPRTWGNQEIIAMKPQARRYIPTHVGKSTCLRSRVCRSSVHPHARGEILPCCNRPRYASGSSPRTWGNQDFENWLTETVRFIPTHVGKSPAPARS